MSLLPFLYDRVHHQGASFFVQGSVAPYVGLPAATSPTAFVNVDTQKEWEGCSKYKPEAIEAFSFSSFFDEGHLLVAVRLEPVQEEPQATKEFLILQIDVAKLSSFSLETRLLEPGSDALRIVMAHLLPHQTLGVTVAFDEATLFSLNHIEIQWADCQRSLKRLFDDRQRLSWIDEAKVLLTGRTDAFPGLEAHLNP